MIVSIRVGPDLYSFLLDTGAAHNAIDPSLSQQLKLDTVVLKPSTGSVLYACAGCMLDGSNVEVKRGSPAEDAMIKAGDKVIGVDGRSKEVLSLHKIRLLLAIPNIHRNIELSRDGQSSSITAKNHARVRQRCAA